MKTFTISKQGHFNKLSVPGHSVNRLLRYVSNTKKGVWEAVKVQDVSHETIMVLQKLDIPPPPHYVVQI